MGPRSEGARKAARMARTARKVSRVLQWGRARRERGKTGRPRGATSSWICFNGAALGGSAESAVARVESADRGVRFNGAALGGGAESARDARAARLGAVRFNGAALGGSAESREDHQRNGRNHLSLQWGRARRERGKPSRTARCGCRRWRFNGAALGGSAERSSSSKVTRYGWTLQWGRARRERGKGGGGGKTAGAPKKLQWGRARRERGKLCGVAAA